MGVCTLFIPISINYDSIMSMNGHNGITFNVTIYLPCIDKIVSEQGSENKSVTFVIYAHTLNIGLWFSPFIACSLASSPVSPPHVRVTIASDETQGHHSQFYVLLSVQTSLQKKKTSWTTFLQIIRQKKKMKWTTFLRIIRMTWFSATI